MPLWIALKIAVGVYLAVILYLFALNGRYVSVRENTVFDQWRKSYIYYNYDDKQKKLKVEEIK